MSTEPEEYWDPQEELNDAAFDDTDWEYWDDPTYYPFADDGGFVDEDDEEESEYYDE